MNMSAEMIGIIIILLVLLGMASGLPLAFVLGGTAMVSGIIFWGPQAMYGIMSSSVGAMNNFVLVAVPLFIFMAMTLGESGLAEDLYLALYKWSGRLRGGLAAVTVVVCTLLAACSGLAAAGILTMGTIALPQMLRHGYNKHIALGSILGGGTLAQLIPPSVVIILYCMVTALSVGKMFAGGFASGFIIAGIFVAYILIRAYFQKELCPALPPEERVSLREKIVSLRSLVLPVILIVTVLGSIFAGIATPTEAAGVGAGGALLCAAVLRRLSWQMLWRSLTASLKVAGMVGWLVLSAYGFSSVFIGSGGGKLVETVLLFLGGGTAWGVLAVVILLLFVAGMIMEPTVIVLVGAPLVVPVMASFGFDLVWFGIIFNVMIQIAFISPPFGYSLFYLLGVSPPGIKTADVYKAAWPFIGLQLICLVVFIIFPASFMWLPHLLYK